MKFISIIVLGIAFGLLPVNGQDYNSNCLKTICKKIKTIDPVGNDFTDLNFLKKDLKGAEIVLLGEQAHGDGSSFAAKSRLAKFLHQEMDFDVLVFESSILDCKLAWDEIKSGSDPFIAFGKGVFKFWSVSEHTTEIIKYIGKQANTNKPLELAGFDLQFSGMIKPEERARAITDFLKKGTVLKNK